MVEPVENQVREPTEQNRVHRNTGYSWKQKTKTTGHNMTGQLLAWKITGRGRLVLRELDLAVYQM